jgi:endoglucanase
MLSLPSCLASSRKAESMRTPITTSIPTATPTSTPGTGCSIHYVVSNQWNTGFTATVNITNTGSTTINGWTLKWTFPSGQVIQPGAWNGTFTQSGSAVTVTNLSYNGTIAPGGSLASPPGFNASWSGSNTNPTAFTLNGVSCTVA